jgi:hypothetical protein
VHLVESLIFLLLPPPMPPPMPPPLAGAQQLGGAAGDGAMAMTLRQDFYFWGGLRERKPDIGLEG